MLCKLGPVTLLRLLLRICAPSVLAEVCSVDCLTTKSLDGFPGLPDSGRNVGVLNLLVDVGSPLGESALHELTLVEPCPQKDSVDTKEHPGALAEGQSGQQ